MKRIYRDLADLDKNPEVGIAACIPNPDKPLKLVLNYFIFNYII